MKTALVFTGLLRCWDLAYPSIKRELLDVYHPDVFFDVWSEVGYYTGKGYLQQPNDQFVKIAENDKGFHSDGKYVDVGQLITAYNPAFIRVSDFSKSEAFCQTFADIAVNAFTRPKNTFAMFLRIYEGIQQLNFWSDMHHIEYDLVIRMRPDFIFNSPLPPLTPDKFSTIRHRNRFNQGTGDSFQAGSPKDMTAFANTIAFLPDMYNRLGVSCPHLFALQTIIDEELPFQELGIEFVVMHSPNGSYQEPTP